MRSLLTADPFLPREAREGIAERDPHSHVWLVSQGLHPCEAAELLDEPCTDSARCQAE